MEHVQRLLSWTSNMQAEAERAQHNGASLAAAFDGRLEAAVAALREKVHQLESELAGCDFHCICISCTGNTGFSHTFLPMLWIACQKYGS